MQRRLFDRQPEIDFSVDPYAETREAARRLAAEFVIDEDRGFDLMLAYGSESAARKALYNRWYNDEVELRSEAA